MFHVLQERVALERHEIRPDFVANYLKSRHLISSLSLKTSSLGFAGSASVKRSEQDAQRFVLRTEPFDLEMSQQAVLAKSRPYRAIHRMGIQWPATPQVGLWGPVLQGALKARHFVEDVCLGPLNDSGDEEIESSPLPAKWTAAGKPLRPLLDGDREGLHALPPLRLTGDPTE